MHRLARLYFAAALVGTALHAQPANDWAGLGRTVTAGAAIQAKTTDNKTFRGQFKAAEDDGLVMSTPSGDQRIPRAMVSRIAVKKPGHRGRNTLIGFGIGAAAGLIGGTVVDARCTGNCIEGNHAYGKEIGTGLGAVIGTIIGVAWPTGGWREVYRAP